MADRRGARTRAAWRWRVAVLLAALALGAATATASELATAQAALADGLYDVAERHLMRHLIQNRARPPAESVTALAWLCQAIAMQQRPADVLHRLSTHPEIVEAGRSVGVFDFWKARALFDLGRVQELQEHVRGLSPGTMQEPYATGLRRLVARAQLAVGDMAGARTAFGEVDRGTTNLLIRAENLLEWAQAEMAAGDMAAGEALLRRQTELGPTNLPLPAAALGRLVSERGRELLGRHASQQRFPLLFKFLDAAATLSVQVHPDDAQAAKLVPPDAGKTEAWFVLEAEPGSKIYSGLKRGIDRAALEEAIPAGKCEECLHWFEPSPGDCVLLAGKGHETSIIWGSEHVPWNEAAVAEEVLREMFGG